VHGQTTSSQRWTERLRLIFVSALQVDKAVFFTAAITVTAFVPLFTMQGVEGQIFGPMARTYGYALAGALLATFTVTPVLASLLLPKHIEETETVIVRALRKSYTPVLRWALGNLKVAVLVGCVFSP
jgi:cobalt-zinc-cadmium resistance protein CzcA